MEAREPKQVYRNILFKPRKDAGRRGEGGGGGGLRSIPTKTLQVVFELEKLSRVFLLEQRKLINFVGILR